MTLALPLEEDRKPNIFGRASLTGRNWVMRGGDERLALTLCQRFALPDSVARVMAGRSIALEDAEDFLEPTLRRLLPDPLHLKDMEKAVTRMARAIENNENICVFGDYDVDGATSSALIIRFCRALGLHVGYYIPDRIREGYGPSAPALQKLAKSGTNLVITVDCGITAHAPLEAARDAGLDVIVLDHHVAEPRLPDAAAIINPNRLDETSPHRHLAAVGVTFLFLVALNTRLRANGFYKNMKEPDLKNELDLVALGTVCDIVALKGINRAFVAQGLRVMASSQNIGLRALLAVGRAAGVPDTYTAGFILGPRVNAGGRVGEADLGVRLLTCEDENEAARLAGILDKLNEERRALEKQACEEAFGLISSETSACAFVASDAWHPGIIGLVASRLVSRFHVPSFVTAFTEDVGKGSCRSVPGIDIGALVIAARQEGLLINGGGHAMAAGYTVARGAYENFRAFIEARIRRQIEAAPLQPTLHLDGLLSVAGLTVELAQTLQRLAPYGASHSEPRFAVMDAKLLRADAVGENHLRLILADDTGASIRAMAWRVMDNSLGPALVAMKKGSRLHVAGTLRLNSWAMRTEAQFIVDDVVVN
jgi:single-stranded-DNA-specific exonuclease